MGSSVELSYADDASDVDGDDELAPLTFSCAFFFFFFIICRASSCFAQFGFG